MYEPNAEDATVRLIVEAAERHGYPGSDVRSLPFAAPGFDAALRRADGAVSRLLGRRIIHFAEDLLDEASILRETVTDPRGKVWDVDARLFSVVVRGTPADLAAMTSPDGLRGFGAMLTATGLAHASSKFGFAPLTASLEAMDDLCPGKVRRLAHCLTSRTVPGFPAPPVHDVRSVIGGSLEGGDPDEPVTRAIVGVRVLRVSHGRALPRDWMCHFGGDAGSVAGGEHDGWGEATAERYAPAGVHVGLPSSWMGTCTEMTVADVLEAILREADLVGATGRLGTGTVHHVGDGDHALVLYAQDDVTLGPVRATRHLMLSGLPLLSADMGNSAVVEHQSVGTFVDALLGAAPRDDDDDEPAVRPRLN